MAHPDALRLNRTATAPASSEIAPTCHRLADDGPRGASITKRDRWIFASRKGIFLENEDPNPHLLQSRSTDVRYSVPRPLDSVKGQEATNRKIGNLWGALVARA